ncbi:MAG: inner membrane CreD family protein [Bacteroidales bacterium]|nr:inner membrane CreD family protein [Bacteroidales bacterium]
MPDDRQVSDTGFTADWKVIALNRGFAQTISFSTFNNTTISHARNEYSEEDKLLFYTLLLSFSEFMAFGWSYLIAAVMTIGLFIILMLVMIGSQKINWYK